MSGQLEHKIKISLDSYSSRIFEIIMSGLLRFTHALSKLIAHKQLPIGINKMAPTIHFSPIGKCLSETNLLSAHGIDLVVDLVAP